MNRIFAVPAGHNPDRFTRFRPTPDGHFRILLEDHIIGKNRWQSDLSKQGITKNGKSK